MRGGLGNDALIGGAGTDTAVSSYLNPLTGGAVHVVLGQGFAHEFDMHSSANGVVRTLVGVDTLSGIENVIGTSGGDTLEGNSVGNVLTGGRGQDTLIGGGGADTFAFNSTADSANGTPDLITDFVSGVDKLDLSGIDANTALAGNQGFSFLGAGAFDNHAAELIYQVIQGSAFVRGDVDGDGVADFTIKLQNVTQLAATDVHL